MTDREDGFVVEGAADSFLSRKPRGVGLAEELGLSSSAAARITPAVSCARAPSCTGSRKG